MPTPTSVASTTASSVRCAGPVDRLHHAPDREGAGAEESGIVSVTIHDTAAAVSVGTRYGAFDYTDILSMLLVDGSVRIVGKAYRLHHKSARKGGLLY
jgi:hypothetical protein